MRLEGTCGTDIVKLLLCRFNEVKLRKHNYYYNDMFFSGIVSIYLDYDTIFWIP